MIKVTIFKNQDGKYTGFDCVGHAGFADEGQDIVCAGVSTLVINTINSIAYFTKEKFSTDSEEESGIMTFHLEKPAAQDAELLLKSMILGLQGIQNNYGNEYMILNFKEV